MHEEFSLSHPIQPVSAQTEVGDHTYPTAIGMLDEAPTDFSTLTREYSRKWFEHPRKRRVVGDRPDSQNPIR